MDDTQMQRVENLMKEMEKNLIRKLKRKLQYADPKKSGRGRRQRSGEAAGSKKKPVFETAG